MEPNPLNRRQYPVEGFSLAERDRRWGRVRALMDAAGIHILVAPNETDSRYLSQMAYDIGPTILPIEGDVTALSNHGRVGSATHEWVTDVREWNRRWTEGMVERLQELDADRKIVGVVGLDGMMRRPDGDLNYNTFVALREAFPRARWVGGTALMQEARYHKSPDEVSFLERAARGTDAGLLAAARHLREGVLDREVWAQMVLAMMRVGTDQPTFAHLGFADMDDIRGFPVQPIGLQARPGHILYTEVDGRFCGYQAQGVQPAVVGPLSQVWRDAWRVHVEAWERTMAILRPGVTFEEILRAADGASAGRFQARQTLHGQGLGDDMPLMTTSSLRANRMGDRILEEGVCFVLKPYARWSDKGGEKELNWGDTVVITTSGARRLGTRPHEIIVND